jgi:hypothetical protein
VKRRYLKTAKPKWMCRSTSFALCQENANLQDGAQERQPVSSDLSQGKR